MDFISHIFIITIYQPFLNILVGIYWFMDLFSSPADMGIAVIIMTIIIRLLLLPLYIAGSRSEKERREIGEEVARLKLKYAHDPLLFEKEKKRVMGSNRRVVIGEIVSLLLQIIVALMLWRIFTTGLSGADIHLIYPFMPDVDLPFNLVFLGKYDLTHPSLFLNLIQSLLIFTLETISLLTSPYKISRKEVVRLQLVLPVVSFIIFMNLPAGKKLFVITSLVVSIILTLIKAGFRVYLGFKEKQQAKQDKTAAQVAGEKTERLVAKRK